MIPGISILILIILLTDFTVYAGIKRVFNLSQKHRTGMITKFAYWGFTTMFILFALIFIIAEKNSSKPDYIVYRSYFTLTGAFILIYFPKILFVLFCFLEFLIRLPVIFILHSLKRKKKYIIKKIAGTKIISITGIAVSAIIFFIILHGIFIGRTNFKTETVKLEFKDLPESFDGLRMGLISDIHLGSFYDSLELRKGIDMLMKEKPDIIFFAGDMINNQSQEAIIMLPELKRMRAPLGMFSILGNHDVGDYRRWKTIEEKTVDFNSLVKIEEEAGFIMLIDQNFILKKNHDSIAIIGVNSWGMPPFKKYGHLKKSMKGIEQVPFKILLTHNPTHWDEEVAGKNDIELTLAGHTHAMQFGINCCGIFWCPLQWMYPHWGGLYNEGQQYLYINRGFGYLGFPGRIGMTPEITIIELRKIR